MKKTILKLFTLITILLICYFFSINNKEDFSEIYEDYKLTTSGAGEAMDAWAFERSYPNKSLSAKEYLKTYRAEKKTALTSVRDGDDCWESLGPENIGGRILCLAFHPTDPNVIYAGSASAGLWRTTSMGKGRYAWEHVPVGFPILGIGAILIDPEDPNVMYLGTGEVYHSFGVTEPGTINRFTRGTYGLGILKTEDGGLTWTQSLSFDAPDLVGVSDMEMSRQNPNEVYAATTLGTYQTLDGGQNWNLIHPVGPAIDIEIDPTNDNILYVSQGNLNTGLDPSLSGLFKSTNKGGDFFEMLDDGLLAAWSGNAKLSLLPGDPNTIYASIQVGWFNNGPTTPAGLFRSTDAGVNWALVNNTNVPFWQGWYSHDIAIHPTDTDEMMYVGIAAWKSENGGSFIRQVSGSNNWQFGKISVEEPEGDSLFIHADIHAVYYHPLDSDKVFFAGDGGVHLSEDRGETFTTLNGGLQTTQFYPDFSTSAQDPNHAIGGTQDNATYIYDGTPSWSRVIGGDGMSTAINTDNDNIVYGSAQGLFLARSDTRGDSFFLISPPTATNELTAFTAPYELAPSNQDIVYAGRQFLYKSTDRGDTWTTTSTNFVDGGNMIIDLAISHSNESLIYAATAPNPFGDISSAKLLRSEDGGEIWIEVSHALPNRIIKDIALDPLNDQVVYVVFSGFNSAHFAKSLDGGANWQLVDELPNVPTNSLFVDPLNGDHIYVGNDLGVYFSNDAGLSWELFSHGLPDATLAMNLSYSEANRKIRLASHGRGVYERNLVFNPETSISDVTLESIEVTLYPNPASNELNIEFDSDQNSKGKIEISNTMGQLVQVRSIDVKEGRNSIQMDVTQILNGPYFATISLEKVEKSIPFIKS
ncbi:MAG: T9SS type A sorting domain-containing protein [Bacteroidota bacterium]